MMKYWVTPLSPDVSSQDFTWLKLLNEAPYA
jgi:hypothetical protein